MNKTAWFNVVAVAYEIERLKDLRLTAWCHSDKERDTVDRHINMAQKLFDMNARAAVREALQHG